MQRNSLSDFVAFTHRSNHGLLDRIVTEVGVAIPVAALVKPNIELTVGLWDTGCTGTAISATLARKIGLTPIGVTQSHHAGGVSENSHIYLIDLYLPNKVVVKDVRAVEVISSIDAWGILIGMNVITLGDFSITNVAGKTVASFRCPSLKMIDYVDEWNVLNMPMRSDTKINRNDLCPCGSTRKYKNCCGRR